MIVPPRIKSIIEGKTDLPVHVVEAYRKEWGYVRPAGGCGCDTPQRPKFDRVVLINLKRRKDRLEAFQAAKRLHGWELPDPEIVEAVDGRMCPVPKSYRAGPGAWGCLRSHLHILERASSDGINSVLVFEDDVTWDRDAWVRLDRFLSAVPNDWEQLMLGGQHMGTPDKVSADVVRCKNTHRTHAYAVRGPAIRDLLALWYQCDTHIDHVMGPWQGRDRRKVYAPPRFVFGQAGGKSDINGAINAPKIWSQPPDNVPFLHLSVPADVVKTLREHGVHTGYSRTKDTDRDVGLEKVVTGPSRSKIAGIQRWTSTILAEAAAVPGTLAACWHPDVTPNELRRVVGRRPVIEIEAGDLSTAMTKIEEIRSKIRKAGICARI